MNLRKSVLRVLGVAAIAVGTVLGTTTTASADPAPAAGWWPYGGTFGALGQNAWCNGLVDIHVETDPTKPAWAKVTAVSRGMNGNGPEWAANPKCKLNVTVAWSDAIAPFYHTTAMPAEFGPEPGASVSTEIHPSSGLAMIGASTSYADPTTFQFQPQISYGGGQGFFIIP
ncbi:hypothetical protein [Rhodococcus sp. HNM0569]|uniref:hypothetical protein n=1 Tax=Rhodococcus sp. HNM0569 TaxID=2716340 RepID=UPI00146C5374|nr:hypothetical protein [Rhodococcus sp. HNM0569]NLU83234.1 hypothetical protein [Rhodococcus sp. HNM0569]